MFSKRYRNDIGVIEMHGYWKELILIWYKKQIDTPAL